MRLGALAAALFILTAVACGDGATEYEVTVLFNTSVTQEDLEEAGDVLRSYDEEVDFLIQESFPPTGRASLAPDVPNFCPTVEVELEPRPYIEGVMCEER
ncbi:MAG: hypothetical protein U1B78_04775 [Dehalococcoidia bacterium]|nr:hypothetical protein [Dehalococcoidia bacterium]